MCLEQEHKPRSKNTNPKIKIQKLKISKSPFSQTQQNLQILTPQSTKSIQKYNTIINHKDFRPKPSTTSFVSRLLPSLSISSLLSTSRTNTIVGTHEFKFNGYSLAKGMGVGKFVASDTFAVGGYAWAVYFYPDGKSGEDNAAYVSLFVALASEGTDVRALFELTLLDQSGRDNHKVHSHFNLMMDAGPYTLKYRESRW